MEITSAEKKVLSGISFNGEEINRGILDENDMTLLSEMRAVSDYLKEKYPSYEFEITGCELKSGTVKTYNEWYYRAKGVDRESAFIATAEEAAGSFDIKDDFYGEVIRKSIRDEFEKILTKNDIPVIEINVGFWEYLGKEYGESISAMDVFKGVIPAGNDVKVFLDGSKISADSYKATVAKIKESFKENEFIGEIYIVILKDAESDFAKDRLYSGSITLD